VGAGGAHARVLVAECVVPRLDSPQLPPALPDDLARLLDDLAAQLDLV
jgi:hypothetical protein